MTGKSSFGFFIYKTQILFFFHLKTFKKHILKTFIIFFFFQFQNTLISLKAQNSKHNFNDTMIFVAKIWLETFLSSPSLSRLSQLSGTRYYRKWNLLTELWSLKN